MPTDRLSATTKKHRNRPRERLLAPGCFALVLGAALFGCTPEIRPVEIAIDEEICSHCRMTVSQREFAAESVSSGGSVEYFDDIGCLARWIVERDEIPGQGLFVVDFETGRWLDGTVAHFVRSRRLHSPMGHGLGAFEKRERAETVGTELDGRVLSWMEVIRQARPQNTSQDEPFSSRQ